jgi:hypothetical protein
MANTVIQLRHSTLTGNVPSTLANGEISINNRDGKFFYSTPDGTIITHYPYPGPAGLNQEVQFNDSGVLGSDSGLTYNKTTDVLTVVGGAIVSGVNVAPQIQFAYNHANAAFIQANTGGADQYARNTANAAFIQANTPSHVANSAAIYANGAFIRANNSLNANVGGTITGNVTVVGNLTSNTITTTGSNGSISGANAIFSNYVFAANGTVDLFIYANNAYTTANGAFAAANAATTTNITQNNSITVALNTANAAFIHANAAFNQANTASGADQFARDTANAAFSKANNALANTSGTTFNGEFLIGSGGKLTVLPIGGEEGGEILLGKPPSGNLDGGITIDAYQDKIRIFEQGGSARGVFIDLTQAAAGVGTNLLSGGGGGTLDQFARNTANAAFIQANTPSHVANSAAIYANGAFAAANAATTTNITQNNSIDAAFVHANSSFNFANGISIAANTPSHVANSAAIYANGAFAAANASAAIDVTQNNSITAAFVHANAAFTVANAAITFTSSATPPSLPSAGDQWYNTNNDILYEYINDGTSDYWVDITSSAITTSNVSITTSTSGSVDILNPFLLAGM